MDAPFMETEEDSSVRVEELTKLVVGRCRWPKRDWYHLRLARTSFTPMIVQVRFMVLSGGCSENSIYATASTLTLTPKRSSAWTAWALARSTSRCS